MKITMESPENYKEIQHIKFGTCLRIHNKLWISVNYNTTNGSVLIVCLEDGCTTRISNNTIVELVDAEVRVK